MRSKNSVVVLDNLRVENKFEVEQRFGPYCSDRLPPVVVPLSSGLWLRFRGRIDRVDLHPSGSRVIAIDYKTGSASPYKEMEADPLEGDSVSIYR